MPTVLFAKRWRPTMYGPWSRSSPRSSRPSHGSRKTTVAGGITGWRCTKTRWNYRGCGFPGNPRAMLVRCWKVFGSPTWTRTKNLRINSPALYRLSYEGAGLQGGAGGPSRADGNEGGTAVLGQGRNRSLFFCWARVRLGGSHLAARRPLQRAGWSGRISHYSLSGCLV